MDKEVSQASFYGMFETSSRNEGLDCSPGKPTVNCSDAISARVHTRRLRSSSIKRGSNQDVTNESKSWSEFSSQQKVLKVKSFREVTKELEGCNSSSKETQNLAKGSIPMKRAEYSILGKGGIKSYACQECFFVHTDLPSIIIHCASHKKNKYHTYTSNGKIGNPVTRYRKILPSFASVSNSSTEKQCSSLGGNSNVREGYRDPLASFEKAVDHRRRMYPDDSNKHILPRNGTSSSSTLSVFPHTCTQINTHTNTGVGPSNNRLCEELHSHAHRFVGHKETGIENIPSNCTSDKISCSSQSQSASHVSEQMIKKPCECLSCERNFQNFSKLNKTKRDQVRDRPYKCRFCVKSYMTPTRLYTHSRIHR